jgi:hypothetical protein
MRWTILAVLLVLWALGMVSSYTLGPRRAASPGGPLAVSCETVMKRPAPAQPPRAP